MAGLVDADPVDSGVFGVLLIEGSVNGRRNLRGLRHLDGGGGESAAGGVGVGA